MIIRSTALTRLCRYSVLSLIANLFLAVTLQAADAADLTVKEFAGAVKLKLDDRWRDPQAGMVVGLPAAVSTGADGSIKLMQDGTVYSIAANTALELVAGAEPGQLVRRIVQSKGSAFYDVSKREQQKLRVETPYLVAVIKGTQFNVTVEPESTSIALFEGLLLVEAPDIGESVNLRAGFIARRHKGDTSITVIPMDNGDADAGKSAAPGSNSGAGGSGDAGLADGGLDGDFVDANADDGLTPVADGIDVDMDLDGSDSNLGASGGFDTESGTLSLEASSDADLGSGDLSADLGADAEIGDIGAGLDAGVDADLGSGELGADLGAEANVGDLGTELDAGVDADLGSGDVGADASVGDTGLDVGVDDGGLDADADLGGLDDTLDVTDDLLGGEETDPDITEEEQQQEEESVPLLDPGNLLGL